ncbi:MAG: PAS domain S-box protein [Myxococcales bacterium]|nr:MAG: PAS domain S-box protein [Myxococcales bacterium]
MGRDSSTQTPSREVQNLQERLRAISYVTRRFAEETTDYARLLDTVAETLGDTLRDSCMVFLLDDPPETVTAVAMHAPDAHVLEQFRESFRDRKIPLSAQPAFQRIVTTGEPILAPRLSATETSPERARWQEKLGLHSALLVPLRVQGRSLGILSLARFRPESPPFDEQDQELAQNLADHAALAMENARLFAAAERARAAVHRSEESRRQFIEASPIARYVISANDLRVMEVNAAALALYGYSRDEFLRLSLNDLRHPDDRQRLMAALDAAGDDHTAGLAKHRRKDGSVLYVEGGSQLASYHGEPARFVVVTDQTKRVRAEQERDQTAERLQSTLDSMKEGYTIMDRELRYVYVNRAGAEQTHLTREELLGRTPLELYPGFEDTPIHLALQAALDTGQPQRVENRFVHSDGETGFFELYIQPVPEGLVVLSVDQTDQRRAENRRDSLEEQLRQAQKMEAVGRLAGGIAHDFNNVLSVILGYGEDILATLKEGDPIREDLQEIHAAATRAAELTRQLLMFSRQQVFEPKVVSLNDVLTGMERMLRRVLGEHLELITSFAPELGRIRADRGHLEQVVLNLVVNARDAMPNGGRLTIETCNVSLDEAFTQNHLGSSPGEYVFLGVTDTGLGMDAATRTRIFEPFFTTKELGKGTGLGLSTVLGIVQQSGGGIWVYSEEGHGTTFKVYLPRVDAELDVRPSVRPTADLLGSETVLLVEDEPGVREVARRVLERAGYQVLVVESPLEALLVGDTYPAEIQLLVTDVVMPKLSGADLAARLLEKRPSIKVLYMSGYTDRGIVSSGVLDGSVPFLQKPFTSEQLARKVRQVLDDAH